MTEEEKNPYKGARGTFSIAPIVITLVLAFGAVIAVCSISQHYDAIQRKATATSTYKETYIPGQPLDAVKLSAPSWSDWEYMWRIADRTSGACWYRIHVDGKWEVYLICEGHSYVQQQQEKSPVKGTE